MPDSISDDKNMLRLLEVLSPVLYALLALYVGYRIQPLNDELKNVIQQQQQMQSDIRDLQRMTAGSAIDRALLNQRMQLLNSRMNDLEAGHEPHGG